jgi:hypothetical protein
MPLLINKHVDNFGVGYLKILLVKMAGWQSFLAFLVDSLA